MEFENLSSSRKAVYELSRKVGSQKVEPRPRNEVQAIVLSLSRAVKTSNRVLKNLKNFINDPEVVSDYEAVAAELKTISYKIINKIGGNLDVKENIKED